MGIAVGEKHFSSRPSGRCRTRLISLQDWTRVSARRDELGQMSTAGLATIGATRLVPDAASNPRSRNVTFEARGSPDVRGVAYLRLRFVARVLSTV